MTVEINELSINQNKRIGFGDTSSYRVDISATVTPPATGNDLAKAIAQAASSATEVFGCAKDD
jgi:hypothetical protein